MLTLTDQGVGIPEADLAQVFQPFVRASNASHIEGSGLGLYVTQQAVACHGGKIEMCSQMGQGTTVIIQFPLSNVAS